MLGEHLLVTTENNGTRLFEFDDSGVIRPEPLARHADPAHDSSTPVVHNGRMYGVRKGVGLYCLDAETLEEYWLARDRSFWRYASLIAGNGAVLVITVTGELHLIADDADEFRLLARMPTIGDDSEVLSHPALVGTRLFIRSTTGVSCVELSEERR